MLVLRTVTAPHVTTVKAHAQVNPGIAHLQTLLAALRIGTNVANRVEVCTLLRHDVLRSGNIRSRTKDPGSGIRA